MLKTLWSAIQAEPVTVQALVQSAIALGSAFGLHLSAEQIAAVLAFSAMVLSVLTRQVVTPNAKLP